MPVDGVEISAGAISDPVITGESGDVVPQERLAATTSVSELAVGSRDGNVVAFHL